MNAMLHVLHFPTLVLIFLSYAITHGAILEYEYGDAQWLSQHLAPGGLALDALTTRSVRPCACSATSRGFPSLATTIIEQYAILLSAYARNPSNDLVADEITLIVREITRIYSTEGFVNADTILRQRLNVGYCDHYDTPDADLVLYNKPHVHVNMVYVRATRQYAELKRCDMFHEYRASPDQVANFDTTVETELGTQDATLLREPSPSTTSTPPPSLLPPAPSPTPSPSGPQAIPLPSSLPYDMPSPPSPPSPPTLIPDAHEDFYTTPPRPSSGVDRHPSNEHAEFRW